MREIGTRNSAWPVWALLALQLFATLPLAWALNLWIDEVYSLHTSAQSPLAALAGGIHFERQAPLYFGLLSLWRTIDPSAFFARLFSVLAISVSLLVVARIARRLFPETHPAWFVAPFALNPSVIWAAVEIRVYAMAILMAALLIWAALAAFVVATPRRRALVGFIAVAAASVYTSYYLGFLLIAFGAALLATGRSHQLGRYALALAVVGVICLPIAIWLPGQTSPGSMAERQSAFGALRFWGTILADQLIPGYRLSGALESRGIRGIARGALCVLVAAAAIRWRLVSRLREREVRLPWVVLAVGALQFAGVAWLVDRALVEPWRYWSYLSLPATVGFVALAAATRSERFLAAAVGVLIAANGAELLYDFWPLAKPSDAARVAALLMREEHAGEPILVFPNEWALPLRAYYRGVNPVVPLPREPSFDRYDARDLVVVSEAELASIATTLPVERGVVWLVKDEQICANAASMESACWEVYRGRDVLERYVDAHFVVEASWPFYRKLVVQRLHRR